MARKRTLFTESALTAAINQGNATLIDREAEEKAFLIDIAQNASNPAKLAEIVRNRELRIMTAVEVFGQSHVKVLNRVIRAFSVTMSNAEKLRVVNNFVKANGGAAKVATLVNASEAEQAKRAEEKKKLAK